jgi:hypothetical protein
VISVNRESAQKSKGKKAPASMFIFPACVLLFYGMLCAIDPNKALMALKTSCNILLYIALPLALVFVIMLMLNLFVKPAQIVRLFGKGVSIKGIVLSVLAGIISTGPIYAWYPLLKNLRDRYRMFYECSHEGMENPKELITYRCVLKDSIDNLVNPDIKN